MSDITPFIVKAALCGLPLSLLLAAAGLPLAGAALLFAPPKRVKVFRDKFGQQTATLCLLTGLAALLLGICAALPLLRASPAIASLRLAWPFPLAFLTGGLALCGLLALFYRAAWQGLKRKRPLHALIGVAATLASWALGSFFLIFFRSIAATGSAPATDPAPILAPQDSLIWFSLPLVFALSLTLAGATAGLYLILRRKKDDFGRDYYNYAVKLACKWALFSCVPALVLHVGLTVRLKYAAIDLIANPLFLWSAIAARVCLALACLFWALVLKNKNPLRLKFLCFCAALLVWMAIAGMIAGNATRFFG